MKFESNEYLPGVWHIADEMDVCVTLLVGEEAALLVDAGYGLGSLSSYIRTITDKPVSLVLTHAHHDHALGAYEFDPVYIQEAELETAAEYTGIRWRKKVLADAAAKGIQVDEETFLAQPMGTWIPIGEKTFDLGGLTARVIPCPGHTPGSAVVYVPELELLLTGDDYNPCTWIFFPEALPVQTLRKNMLDILDLPFRKVLCPHRMDLHDRYMIDDFFEGMTDEVLDRAAIVDTGLVVGRPTKEACPAPGQVIVFDPEKREAAGKEEGK